MQKNYVNPCSFKLDTNTDTERQIYTTPRESDVHRDVAKVAKDEDESVWVTCLETLLTAQCPGCRHVSYS